MANTTTTITSLLHILIFQQTQQAEQLGCFVLMTGVPHFTRDDLKMNNALWETEGNCEGRQARTVPTMSDNPHHSSEDMMYSLFGDPKGE